MVERTVAFQDDGVFMEMAKQAGVWTEVAYIPVTDASLTTPLLIR